VKRINLGMIGLNGLIGLIGVKRINLVMIGLNGLLIRGQQNVEEVSIKSEW
jgi:hypothetical protein